MSSSGYDLDDAQLGAAGELAVLGELARLPCPTRPLPFVAGLPGDWEGWLRRAEVVPRTPFLLSPSLGYDVVLNGLFQSVGMLAKRG